MRKIKIAFRPHYCSFAMLSVISSSQPHRDVEDVARNKRYKILIWKTYDRSNHRHVSCRLCLVIVLRYSNIMRNLVLRNVTYFGSIFFLNEYNNKGDIIRSLSRYFIQYRVTLFKKTYLIEVNIFCKNIDFSLCVQSYFSFKISKHNKSLYNK